MKRSICVGDVHQCKDSLVELLDRVKYVPGRDVVYLTGDLTDRGPAKDTVEFCRKMGFLGVLSNHDERYFRYRKHARVEAAGGKKNPMKLDLPHLEVYQTLSDEDLDYIGAMPPYRRITDNWVLVHAGIEPAFPLDKQDPKKICRIRYADKDTKYFKASHEPRVQPPNSVLWPELYTGKENVVYGHCVNSLEDVHITKSPGGALCYGIDTGCVYGGKLSALVIEELDNGQSQYYLEQVKAKQAYAFWDHIN